MRIATFQFHQQSLRSISQRQGNIANTEQQISHQQRLLSAADDPAAASRLLRLDEQSKSHQRYGANIDQGVGQLSLAESALNDAENVLFRVKELTVQAGSAALNDRDRANIAAEVDSLKAQLFALANSQDAQDNYLFSGFQSDLPPFVNQGGSVHYQGDHGQRLLAIGDHRQLVVSDPGSEIFQGFNRGGGLFQVDAEASNSGTGVIYPSTVVDPSQYSGSRYSIEFTAPDRFTLTNETTGNPVLTDQPYTSQEAITIDGLQVTLEGAPAVGDRFRIDPAEPGDLFATLDQLAAAMRTPGATPLSRTQREQAMANASIDLDRGLDSLLDARGRIGTRLSAAENQRQSNEDQNLAMQRIINDLGGLDFAAAATELSRDIIALEAAQQTYSRTQDLSLFRFL